MGGDGASDISAGAGEGVGGMMNGAGLTSKSIARSGTCGGGSSDLKVSIQSLLFYC